MTCKKVQAIKTRTSFVNFLSTVKTGAKPVTKTITTAACPFFLEVYVHAMMTKLGQLQFQTFRRTETHWL